MQGFEEETKPTWASVLPPIPPPESPGARAAELVSKAEAFLEKRRRRSARKSELAKALGVPVDEAVAILSSSSRFERQGPGYWRLRAEERNAAGRPKPTGPRAAVLTELRQRLAELDRERAQLENAIRLIERLGK